MRFILLSLIFLFSSCSQTHPPLSKEDKNTHKISSNQIEAKKAQEEYQKRQSLHP